MRNPRCPGIVCPFGFWGLACLLEVPEPPPAPRSIDHVVCSTEVDPAVLAGTGAGLDQTQLRKHLAHLRTEVRGFPIHEADVVTTNGALYELLRSASMDVVYLLSHAEAHDSSENVALIFPDGPLTSEQIIVWARDHWPVDHWGTRRPLVVLNACHTTEVVQSTMTGFVSNFVGAGAAGVVGTETLIEQQAASMAMRYFLADLSAGAPVGEAIRSMRWRLLSRGNLLGFAYTPYCAASLRLRREPSDYLDVF